MFDIIDKDKLIKTIQDEIGIPYYPYSSYSSNFEDKIREIARYEANQQVQFAINRAVEAIIKHLYTHSEFEKDIGLKD